MRRECLRNETFDKVQTDGIAIPIKLGELDLIRVRKASAAFRGGRSVTDINATATDEQHVRLSYTRDDDKTLDYDCHVEGDVLRVRMIDEVGPGTGPSMWSGKGSTTTYKIDQNSVKFNDDLFDGYLVSETIQI